MSEQRITLSELGEPLVTARSSEIYPLPAQRILKLFHPVVSEETARWERVNAEEAHAKGATRISCHGEVEVGGRYGIIMSRLDGTTLTKSMDSNPFNLLRMPLTLARLHANIHGSHTEKLQDVRQVIANYLDRPPMGFLPVSDRELARRYILGLPAGNSLLHMDFHTDNILVSKHDATVIDWATAARGEAGADLAMTYFLFNEAELFPGISKLQEMLYNAFRKLIYRGYERHYKAIRGLSTEEFHVTIQRWYLPILICRLAAWEAPTEVESLRRKIKDIISKLSRSEGA